jgi:hypothetical protein
MPRGRKSNRKASYIIDMTDRRQTGFIFIESCQSYLFCELERERDRERERERERKGEKKDDWDAASNQVAGQEAPLLISSRRLNFSFRNM